MNEHTHRIIGVVEYCGAFALALVAIPLLALAFFVTRGVLVVVAMVGLAGAGVLWCAHPGFRSWLHHMGDPKER